MRSDRRPTDRPTHYLTYAAASSKCFCRCLMPAEREKGSIFFCLCPQAAAAGNVQEEERPLILIAPPPSSRTGRVGGRVGPRMAFFYPLRRSHETWRNEGGTETDDRATNNSHSGPACHLVVINFGIQLHLKDAGESTHSSKGRRVAFFTTQPTPSKLSK